MLVFRLATARSVEGKMLRRAADKMRLERLVVKRGVFKEVIEVSCLYVWGGGMVGGIGWWLWWFMLCLWWCLCLWWW